MNADKPILVVDDDIEIRTFLRSLLETHGFTVVDAARRPSTGTTPNWASPPSSCRARMMASQKVRSTALRGGFAHSAYHMYGLTRKTHPAPCISALLLSHRLTFCEIIKDGIETIRTFKKHSPSVKIIAMSGLSGRDECYLNLAALGAHRILAKPFSIRQLLDCLDDLLPHRRPN